jgi:endo-1,4-beta-mannosidase
LSLVVIVWTIESDKKGKFLYTFFYVPHSVHFSTGRPKRDIQSSGLPVISESYGVDFKLHNNSSEGLRLYESLVSSGGKNEPKDPSLDWGSTENPIKSYHR